MEFKKLCKENLNIDITDEMMIKFNKYYELLIYWNERINLTGITEKKEVFLKHFYDSLTIIKNEKLDNQKLCDVGAGAGFPSVVLKIVFKDLDITIVDSLNKRIKFLNIVIEELDLKNIRAVHARAEEFSEKNRERFDIVTARAVAKLNILIELCSKLVKVNGLFIALKGSTGLLELEDSINAQDKLNFREKEITEFFLPIENSKRVILSFEKFRTSPYKYPRNFSMIKKKPL